MHAREPKKKRQRTISTEKARSNAEKMHATMRKRHKQKLLRALKAYREFGTMKDACETADISRSSLIAAIKRYPKFAREWENAYEDYLDMLEHAATTRAKSGSDRLLMFMLKGGRREKYSEGINVNNTKNTVNISAEQMVLIASEVAKEIAQNAMQRRKIEPIGADMQPKALQSWPSHPLDYEMESEDDVNEGSFEESN